MPWVSRLTTIAIVVVLAGLVVLVIRSSIPSTEVGEGFRTYAKFRDGSRLAVGSPVVIAGVRVGDISRLSIEGRFARVDMKLLDDVQIPVDAYVTRRSDSLFGDSYIEIIVSMGEEPATTPRLLRSGEPITHVIEGSSTDTVLRAIDRSMPKIDNALQTVHDATAKGRRWVNGDLVEAAQRSADWLTEGHIEGPIHSAHQAVTTLEDMTTRGADAVAGAAPQVNDSLRRFEEGIARARRGLADAKTDLVTGLRDTRAGLDQVDEPLAKATEVMAAINNGEGEDCKGTLCRLVNDPQLGDDLEDATESGREAVSSFYRFKSWLGMRMEYNLFSRIPRFYAIAEIRARTDKFYLVELERGGLGGVPADQISDATGTDAYTRHQEIRDTLRFTAQFGKQMGRFSVRGGIKDSTFGAGADALFVQGRLKVSADVFGSFDPTPRVKVAAAFAVFRSIYVIAGIDDALNDPGYLRINNGIGQDVPIQFTEVRYGRDWFLGASLHFDDADLATLLRVYGALLVSALAF